MKTLTKALPLAVSFFFILLFIYASASKILDFENFQVQLAQSPLLSAYAGFVSYAVIIFELLIAVLLCFKRSRLTGLYASSALMAAFTVYIFLILNYSDFVPCSCGGILEKMGWTEHLIFNCACVVMANLAIAAGYPLAPLLSDEVHSEEERNQNYRQRRAGVRALALSAAAALAVPAGLMTALFFSSEHVMTKENNFTRRFPHHPILEQQSYDLKVNSYYFAGHHDGTVYLGNLSSPFRLFTIDRHHKKMDTLDLIPATNHRFRNLRYVLQEKILYAYDGTVPVIYASLIDSLKNPLFEMSVNDVYFDQMVPLSPSEYVMRVKDKATQRAALASLSLFADPKVRIINSVLTRKADGGFDADGRLLYDAACGRFYYMFYYRNQILQFDKHLEVTARMKTIDTISTSQIQTTVLKDGSKKMSAPPVMVNKEMTAYKGLIFNRSNLTGKHEPKEMWKRNAVVDIYTTAPAGYWGSMYVQNRGKNAMSQMLVTDRYFYILSGNEIVRYRFAQTLTENFIKGGSRKPVSE